MQGVRLLLSETGNWRSMNSVLIDTNLLVLLIVGSTDRKLIEEHRRTKAFVTRDYDELCGLLEGFDEFWITSHCLAETSNLLKHTGKRNARSLLTTLAAFCSRTRESYLPKARVFADDHFLRLGVADTGFVQKSKRVSCSITMDVQLYETIRRLGRNVVNFNHVRTYLIS